MKSSMDMRLQAAADRRSSQRTAPATTFGVRGTRPLSRAMRVQGGTAALGFDQRKVVDGARFCVERGDLRFPVAGIGLHQAIGMQNCQSFDRIGHAEQIEPSPGAARRA
ncbi:MAG TPA: hypothetical protein VM555_06715 [Tahibacter sp.]|nr:hypothetical protein [Tahibacter sp.]